jgi:uncharacterized protein (DUF2062 family)
MTQRDIPPNVETSSVTSDVPVRPSYERFVRWIRYHQRRVTDFMKGALGQDVPPRKLALSFAVGVFCSLLPFPGHTLVIVGIALAFRLNVAAGIAGAWVNLPPMIPFTYGFAFLVGEMLTRQPLPKITTERIGDIAYWWEMLRAYFYPMAVGTTVVGTTLAIPGYFVAYYAILRMRRAPDPPEHSEEQDSATLADEPDPGESYEG